MAWNLVSSVIASDLGSITTGAIDTTGSDLLIVYVGTNYPTFTLSDSYTNTWNLAVYSVESNYNASFAWIYYVYTPTVGSGHTFSASVVNHPTIFAQAWSGASATPGDQADENSSVDTTTVQAGSITPSEDGCLVVSIGGFYTNGTVDPTIDGGFTIEGSHVYGEIESAGDGTGVTAAVAYLIQTSAAAANPTWTEDPFSTFQNACIASFKPATAATKSLSVNRSPLRIWNRNI